MTESTPPPGAQREGLTAVATAPPAPLSRLGRGTLGRQLALRTTAIVGAIALLLGIASTLAVRHQLLGNVDAKLEQAVVRTLNDDRYGSAQHFPRHSDQPPPGTEIGQVTITDSVGQLAVEGDLQSLSPSVLRQVAAAAGPEPSTVRLDGLGSYRVLSRSGEGTTAIVALPLGVVDHTLRQLVLTELALTLAALAAAAALALALVRSALRPLNRLAATATQVSTLALDRGEVALPVRVTGPDADPRSEVGRVGQAFNHMLNNVEHALAARQDSETKVRRFVADASHELRNPLAAIRGYAELTARGRDQLPPDAAHAIGRIQAESTRMSSLVEDMLLLARLDDDPTLELTEVDVVEVVLNAVSDAQVAGRGHVWQLDLPDAPVVARADSLKLHQVVANLLSNARKHTPEGTTVTTGVSVRDRYALVTVVDDGPGIDPAVAGHVFERFARADTARAHSTEGSTGLGLAIVAAVMEAHGGRAGVDSRPGHTCFTLELPLA